MIQSERIIEKENLPQDIHFFTVWKKLKPFFSVI